MSPAFHIAVIDDHKDIRELLVRYLGEHGYRVSAAESVAAFRRRTDAPDGVAGVEGRGRHMTRV